MPVIERTVVLVKPDGVQRGMIGEIIHRFERKGLQLIGLKMMSFNDALLKEHYAHHTDKDWFSSFAGFMKSSPIIAMVWQGPQAIDVVRTLVGPTKGHEAAPGTIRGDFTIEASHNAIHASDSTDTATAEIERFFQTEELFEYTKTSNAHLYDPSR